MVRQFERAEGDAFAVWVKATDYNGKTWDGSPFSAFPSWLEAAVGGEHPAVRPVTPGSTDYAEWEVDTERGTVLASPGDFIAIGAGNTLKVFREVVPKSPGVVREEVLTPLASAPNFRARREVEDAARAACLAEGFDPDEMVYPGVTMPAGYTKPVGPPRPRWTFRPEATPGASIG